VKAVRLICALLMLIAAIVAAPPAASAGARSVVAATWQLVDYHPDSCVTTRGGTKYYGIFISGSWATAIDVGAASLPAGASFSTSYAPIAPGSSTGVYSLAYVAVAFPANLPLGTIAVSIWADDGLERQSLPWTLRVQARCGY